MQKLFQKRASISISVISKGFGKCLAPFRFLTPSSIRSSRRLPNSLRSNILAAQLRRVPSKSEFPRLNLQWSLRLFPKAYALAMNYNGYGDASHKRFEKKGRKIKRSFFRPKKRTSVKKFDNILLVRDSLFLIMEPGCPFIKGPCKKGSHTG